MLLSELITTLSALAVHKVTSEMLLRSGTNRLETKTITPPVLFWLKLAKNPESSHNSSEVLLDKRPIAVALLHTEDVAGRQLLVDKIHAVN